MSLTKQKNSLDIVKRSILPKKGNVDVPAPLDLNEEREVPKVVVVNDSGVGSDCIDLRDDKANVPDDKANVIIYHMSAPLWKGKLWSKMSNWPQNKLVVVIDADDLRSHGIQISRGISWEKTMEDFREHLQNPLLKQKEIHVLVRCSYEGVFYLGPAAKSNFIAYVVPNMAEGDLFRSHGGLIPGIEMAFLAGLVSSLYTTSLTSPNTISSTSPYNLGFDLKTAIKTALGWSHRFAFVGLKQIIRKRVDFPSGFDLSTEAIERDEWIAPLVIECRGERMPQDEDWHLFDFFLKNKKLQSATRFITGKPEEVTNFIPTARFGNLLTADRYEIECFRSTAAVLYEYLHSDGSKPLSIAVFGQPGSGKSFGVEQVIRAVVGDCGKGCELLGANLSQFLEYSDLVTTFHTIRDIALSGKIPVVLFDEFDTSFNQELGWLKYFLAPMQDGYFLEDGHARPLGRAIYVFIGGTATTFADFTNDTVPPTERDSVLKLDEAIRAGREARAAGWEDEERKLEAEKEVEVQKSTPSYKAAKQVKKPDFVSRLSAYIDIRGPNENGPKDKMYSIRRAMILRNMLEKRLKVKGGNIQVEEKVLNALLSYPSFRHGARSLDLILQMSRLTGRTKFESSDLPSNNQLSMHVNVDEFRKLMEDSTPGNYPHQIDLALRATYC